MDPVLAMALGAGEATPFRLTAAYSAFVNGGRRIKPHLIELVEDRDGKTIFRADSRECRGCSHDLHRRRRPDLAPEGQQLVDPITAYQIATMLEGVVQHGTGRQARVLGRPIGGKTGTTNDFRSAWFIGFTPQIVVGTFVGFDDNRSLGKGETGAVAAVPIFIEFMQEAPKGFPLMDFTGPAWHDVRLGRTQPRGVPARHRAARPRPPPVAEPAARPTRRSPHGPARAPAAPPRQACRGAG